MTVQPETYKVTMEPVTPVGDSSLLSEGAKKKLERDARLREEKKAAIAAKKQESDKRRDACRLRTLSYEKAYEDSQKKLMEARKAAESQGGFYKPEDPKVFLVVRLKGVNKISPKPRKVFQLFRLLQINNASFIKVNKATLNMLKYIEPFVAYGNPNLSTIRKLIYKRGYGRVGRMGSRQRIRIQDNDFISEHLGKYGIHCVEDMVHEIYTCGNHFKEVNSFLWTFKLRAPSGGFNCKRHGFAEFRKGDWGNREQYINQLVAKMV